VRGEGRKLRSYASRGQVRPRAGGPSVVIATEFSHVPGAEHQDVERVAIAEAGSSRPQ
jgi:hypothetical protein